MSATIRTEDEFGWQTRVSLGADGLLSTELAVQQVRGKPTPLQTCYARWQNRQRFGFTQVDAYEDAPVEGASTFIIDVTADAPLNYNFISLNALCISALIGRRFADHPIYQLTQEFIVEYLITKTTGQPAGHHITHDFGGFGRDYLRLLLPLCDRRGNVVAIAGVSKHLQAPIGVAPTIRPC